MSVRDIAGCVEEGERTLRGFLFILNCLQSAPSPNALSFESTRVFVTFASAELEYSCIVSHEGNPFDEINIPKLKWRRLRVHQHTLGWITRLGAEVARLDPHNDSRK